MHDRIRALGPGLQLSDGSVFTLTLVPDAGVTPVYLGEPHRLRV